MMNAKNILARLAGKYFVAPSGCWEWTASFNGVGYGQLSVDGKPMNASRAAFIAHGGEIPSGYDVCHTCDNRRCINPSHLFAGTRKENIQDAASKGRLPRGERRSNSKLDGEAVLVIRGMVKAGIAMRTIAHEFGISAATVIAVIQKRVWGHIPEITI
jgi:hypothetical protein